MTRWIVACALLLASCEGTEEVASYQDGALHVTLAAETYWSGGGRLPGYITRSVLQVRRGGDTFTVAARCHSPEPELAGDGSTERFAYRCAASEAWRVVYLSRRTGFALCGDAAGAGGSPRFDAVPTDFDAAIGALGACATEWNPVEQAELFEELGSLDDARMVDFLFETRDVHLWDWREHVDALPAARRDELTERLRPSLAADASRHLAVCRAIALVPEDDPALRAQAADRLWEILRLRDDYGAGTPSGRGEHTCAPHLATLLRLSRETAPERAAESACTLLSQRRLIRQQGTSRVPLDAFEPAMEALAGHDCAAVAEQLSDLRCESALLCDGSVCTAEQARAELDADEAPAPTRAFALPLLVLAYERDTLPEDVERAGARRGYSVTRDTEETCKEIPDRALVEQAVCGRSYDPVVPYRCGLTIDDAAQTIRVAPRDPGR